MEIGITWENELVYNRTITKSDITKTAAILLLMLFVTMGSGYVSKVATIASPVDFGIDAFKAVGKVVKA